VNKVRVAVGTQLSGEDSPQTPPAFQDPPDLARRRRLLQAALKRREALKRGRALRAGEVANPPPERPAGLMTDPLAGQTGEV
jgi:hypothetical protein